MALTSMHLLWINIDLLCFIGRMDVDEMIRSSMSEQDANNSSRITPLKQKLETIADETEPDVKKLK
jgi:hypothetical protein